MRSFNRKTGPYKLEAEVTVALLWIIGKVGGLYGPRKNLSTILYNKMVVNLQEGIKRIFGCQMWSMRRNRTCWRGKVLSEMRGENRMKHVFFLFLLISFSAQAQKPEPLFIGDKAPQFRALDQYEKPVSLKERLKNGPVVLVFYRGQWCPHCNRHMSQIQDSLQMIIDAGASVIAITPEKGGEIEKTVKKTEASFSIVYDENHRIMDKYKVTFKLGGFKRFIYGLVGININRASGNKDNALPVPATYIIATDGTVFSSHFNEDYTERMQVKDMLEVLKDLKNGTIN